MNDLYNRIETLCKGRGINVTEMCKQSGASRGSLTDLKKGRINVLTTPTLEKIAAFFSVSVDSLLGIEQKKELVPTDGNELSNYDLAVLNWFRSLPEEKRQAILKLGDAPADLIED